MQGREIFNFKQSRCCRWILFYFFGCIKWDSFTFACLCVAIKDLNWADKLINHISKWISFDIARPLLYKMPYVVSSDFTNLQNGELSPPDVSNNVKEVQYDDIHQDSNDPFMCEDEEMIDHEYESLSDESDTESTGLRSIEIEDGDISNILIGLKGSHLRYKVCVSQCRCIDDSAAAYNFDY